MQLNIWKAIREWWNPNDYSYSVEEYEIALRGIEEWKTKYHGLENRNQNLQEKNQIVIQQLEELKQTISAWKRELKYKNDYLKEIIKALQDQSQFNEKLIDKNYHPDNDSEDFTYKPVDPKELRKQKGVEDGF
jgi:chromosome segregation ATPase